MRDFYAYCFSRIYRIKRNLAIFSHSKIRVCTSCYIIVTLYLTSRNIIFLILSALLLYLFRKSKLFIFISVLFSIAFYINFESNYIKPLVNVPSEIKVKGFILSEPKIKEYDQEIVIKADGINGLILAKLPKYPKLYLHDHIVLEGTLIPPKNFSDFDYVTYLRSQKIFYVLQVKNFNVEPSDDLIKNLRNKLKTILIENIDFTESFLLSGIIYGENNSYTDEFKNGLRNSGLYHIVSVSGFNFTIIYTTILSISGLINRKVLMLISIPLILFYLLVVGFDNLPAQRATIMILFTITSLLLGKKQSAINFILLSITLILAEYPLYWTNISFLLSFSALGGLFLFSNKVKDLLLKNKYLPMVIVDILSSTIAVMLTTSFISILLFNNFSVISLFSNLIILPLIPIVIYFGILLLASGLLNLTFLTYIISIGLQLLLKLIVYIINIFGEIKLESNTQILAGLIFTSAIVILAIFYDYQAFSRKT